MPYIFKKGLSYHSGGRSFRGTITEDQFGRMEKLLKASKHGKSMADYIIMPKQPKQTEQPKKQAHKQEDK